MVYHCSTSHIFKRSGSIAIFDMARQRVRLINGSGTSTKDLLVLSREWMGCWGLLGWLLITSGYGSFPHSLRLAPVRGVLHKSSQLWCCSCWKTRNQRAPQSPWLAWPMKLAPRRNGGVCVYIQCMPAKQTSAWHIDITFPDFADGFFSQKTSTMDGIQWWKTSLFRKHILVGGFKLFFIFP